MLRVGEEYSSPTARYGPFFRLVRAFSLYNWPLQIKFRILFHLIASVDYVQCKCKFIRSNKVIVGLLHNYLNLFKAVDLIHNNIDPPPILDFDPV